MNKQRMLSAMAIVVALNMTTNCTTQTMLEISAKESNKQETKLYTTTRVNFREKPSIKSEVIKVLDTNCCVKKIKQSKKWVKVKYNGKTGYVHKNYLSKKKTKNKTTQTGQNRWNITLNQTEIDMLEQITYYESRGDVDVGQQAVVEVILNRMKNKTFPDTLYGVISQKGQFSSYKRLGGSKYKPEYDVVKKNVKKVLNGETNILSNDYLYFSVGGHASHSSMVRVGAHQFCKTY